MANQSSAATSFIDVVAARVFQHSDFAQFIEDVRARYDLAPDELPQATREVVDMIYRESHAFLVAQAQQIFAEAPPSSDDPNMPLGFRGFMAMHPQMAEMSLNMMVIPSLATSLVGYIVTGEFTGPTEQLGIGKFMDGATELLKKKRGRPPNHVFNTFVRDRVRQGYVDEDIGGEWQLRHPEEYPKLSEDEALLRVIHRIRQIKRRPI
jgi:hypothetical protein